MAKRVKKEEPVTEESKLQQFIKAEYDSIPKNPARHFTVGQRVIYGGMENVYIREIFEDGMYYKIDYISVNTNYGNPIHTAMSDYQPWHELYPYDIDESTPLFRESDRLRMQQLNTSIDSLICRYYHAGIDMNPEYQRDYVWSLEDKVYLIESIFNNIEIGRLVFNRKDFGTKGNLYEIIDGKQRLSTIIEFYEDRFEYKGYKYSQLRFLDRVHFEQYPVVMSDMQEATREQKLRAFIKLNTAGKIMSKQQIEKVRKMLEDVEKHG